MYWVGLCLSKFKFRGCVNFYLFFLMIARALVRRLLGCPGGRIGRCTCRTPKSDRVGLVRVLGKRTADDLAEGPFVQMREVDHVQQAAKSGEEGG